jgi:hypothetical protein
MKKVVFYLSIFYSMSVVAQNGFSYSTSMHTVQLIKQINISEIELDFAPTLIHLTSAIPAPISEVKSKKEKLDLSRENRLQTQIANPLLLNKTAAPSPEVLTNFDGDNTNSTPNDNDLAVSNGGYVVSVVNSNIYVFDSTGKKLLGRTLSSFANVLGSLNRTFDPRIIYDPIEDKFVLVFLQGSTSADTRIIVGFSQSNNPTKLWNFYTIPGNVTGDQSWSDYPILSLSSDDLYITVNAVKDKTPWQQGFITSYIWQCDKKSGFAGLDSINPILYNNINYNGNSIWNICPVKGGSTLYGPGMFFVSQRPADLQNDTVFLHEITHTNKSGIAAFKSTQLRTNLTYGLQPNAIQPNGKRLQTNDSRMLSACYENGFIHYVGNTIDTSKFVPAVYYGRIYDVHKNPTIEGKIISYDTMDIGYPSISYIGGGGGDNSMLITFSHVSPTQFPGTSVVFVDRLGNISAPVFVKKGIGNINVQGVDIERWGDYTGNQRKYDEPGVCWINGSWGNASGANKTWIAKIRSNDPTLSLKSVKVVLEKPIIYPNPVSETITIDFNTAETFMGTFEIMDVKGQHISTLLRDKIKAGSNRFIMDVEKLQNGIYFLMIKYENNIIQQQKFIVHH